MLISDVLKQMFRVNDGALRINAEGVTHDESLNQPEPGGNCLNWVVGHIVASRNGALRLLRQEPIWSEERADAYKRGSAPMKDRARAIPLAELMEDFQRTQERIIAGLERATEADLAVESGDSTVAASLAFLHFHEAYHIGQVAILRRLAGKEGVIR